MGENPEREEGETNSSANEGIDPDVDLSYIDEKIENVLGHFQKDFEGGGVSVDQLGPKFGAYGSFLPCYKHSPVLSSHQRTPQRNPTAQRYPSNLSLKSAGQNFQPSPIPSCKLKSHDHPQTSQDSGSLSMKAPEKASTKKAHNSISANDHKPVRVRIKMGSEILSRKVAMVYSGLGLDVSPTSSPGNSHDGSKIMLLPTSQDMIGESPSSILRDMTLVPVSEALLSPLSDSLLSVIRKAKQETSVDNELLDKTRNKTSVMSRYKSCDVLGVGNALKMKQKRKMDDFVATTNKESPSFEEVKKRKIISTGQKAGENSKCGLRGASSGNDVLTSQDKSQKDINKEGESDRRIRFHKSNKMKVSGDGLKDPVLGNLERRLKVFPTKSKAKLNTKIFDKKTVSGVPLKDAAYVCRNNLDTGVGFEVTPSSTSLVELDNWVQCDNCETWRLLPFGMKPEQLPDKWLCKMQSWLPGMNHCSLSQEETVIAVKSLSQTSGSEVQNLETGVSNLGSNVGRVDQTYQHHTSGSLPNQMKKSTVKGRSKGGSINTLVVAANSMKSNLEVPVKMKSLKHPLQKHNATGTSVDHNPGTASQVMKRKKRENDKDGCETSKKMKTGDGDKLSRKIELKDTCQNLNPKTAAAERIARRYDSELSTSGTEKDGKKRLLTSKNTLCHKSQTPSSGVAQSTETYYTTTGPGKKKRLMQYEANHDGDDAKMFAERESKESPYRETTTKVSSAERKELKIRQGVGMHQTDGFGEHSNLDVPCRYFSCGGGQVSGIVTSSSSKVLDSHKSGRSHVEEVKASPVESVSSSPTRSSCQEKLASAGDSTLRKKYKLNCSDSGSKIINNRIPLDPEGDGEIVTTSQPMNKKQSNPELCNQSSELDDLPCTNRNNSSPFNQIQDYPSESKVDPLNLPASRGNVYVNGAGVEKFSALAHGTIGSSSRVVDVLKDANKLRKLADCFKSNGFVFEHKEAIFKAVLKFLYGASLLETCSGENVQHGEMNHVEAYRTAAKLSESCADEYERSQEMLPAALAYKCVEVAYLRVVYGKSLSTSRDWKELKTMLQMVPQGESPSSSASDIDTSNHQGTMDKPASSKGAFPRTAGSLHIGARSHHNFVRLLDFTQDMNLAMEASTRSQKAFGAGTITIEAAKNRNCINSIKRVVDFSFQDVEAFIRLVELAMDALSHLSFGGSKH